MKNIDIDVIGTIHITNIYEDELCTVEVSEEKRAFILEELRSGSLFFSIAAKTIIEFLDFRPKYWCAIEAGNDLEYQFTDCAYNKDDE